MPRLSLDVLCTFSKITVTEALVLRPLLEDRGRITESIRILVPVDRMQQKCFQIMTIRGEPGDNISTQTIRCLKSPQQRVVVNLHLMHAFQPLLFAVASVKSNVISHNLYSIRDTALPFFFSITPTAKTR